MKPDQLLTKLVNQTAGEEIPHVEVTEAVLGQLASSPRMVLSSAEDSSSDRLWITAAACAVLAASITIMLGSDDLFGEAEPVFELLQTAQVAF